MNRTCAGLLLILFFSPAISAQENNNLPGFASWNLNYGEYLVESGEYFEALEAFQTAIESTADPEIRADAYLHKALILTIYLDSFAGAAKEYETLLAYHGDTDQAEIALFRLAQLYFQQEQYQMAVSQFNAYNERYPRGRFSYQVQILLRKAHHAITSRPADTIPSDQPEEADKPLPVISKLKFDRPVVRVLLIKSTPRITIESEAPVRLNSLTGKAIRNKSRKLLEITARNGRIFLQGRSSGVQALRIEGDQHLEIRQKEVSCGGQSKAPGVYRGALRISLHDDRLQVVNEVDIEEYLYGVVPAEMLGSWPVEALKAQAIAARTYAFYHQQRRSNSAFDVHDTPRSQTYKGVGCEFKKSTRAVRLTQGTMLFHDHKPILAMYTANTGWHSAHVGHIFGESLPYLVGVEDPFSPSQTYGRWTKVFSLAEIQEKLKNTQLPNKDILKISPKGKTPSGRITRVDLLYRDRSELHNIRSRTILRQVLKLPEVLLDITRKGDSLIFKGSGLGHGVGMSQWGAKAMASLNKSYEDILLFYYHEVDLQQVW